MSAENMSANISTDLPDILCHNNSGCCDGFYFRA